MRRRGSSSARNQWIVVTLLLAVTVALTSCGGSGASSGAISTPPGGSPLPATGNTVAILNVGDAPADRVVSFEVTIQSVTLTKSDNTTITIASTPRRVEVTHVSGSAEPLVVRSIPQGTYTQATVVFSQPDVVFIDNSGNAVEREDTTVTKTVQIPFSPSLTVGTMPVVLLIDVNAQGSITIDPVAGTVAIDPRADMQEAEIRGRDQENEQEVEDGAFEHVVGAVASVSGNSFTINVGSEGASISFSTDANTRFEGVAGVGNLAANSMVRVEANAQQDGSILAKEVEVVSSTGTEMEGLITSTTGNPVTSFKVVVQDGSGSGMAAGASPSTLTVNISNRTRFRVDAGKIDLGGLNLPDFNASSLSQGQSVEAESDLATANGVLAAESVKLQEQALVGTISAPTASQFTLTVASDSAFALLTGKTTLTVFTQKNTRLKNNVTITSGANVKVRGLVFFDPAQGIFEMVAGRITTP